MHSQIFGAIVKIGCARVRTLRPKKGALALALALALISGLENRRRCQNKNERPDRNILESKTF